MSNSKFASKWGFILAAVGSAVGMANVWGFSYKVGLHGGGNSGGAFIIAYLFFIALFSYCGLSAEYAIGRRAKTGTLGAYQKAWETRGLGKIGKAVGWLPLLGSMAIAIGYAVIISYVFKALIDSLTGTIMRVNPGEWFAAIALKGVETFEGKYTPSVIFANYTMLPYHIIILIISLATLLFAASSIEKTNKVMMPVFGIMFVILAIRILFLPGMAEGYKFIFSIDFRAFANPMMYVWAAGQAFFSLSITGSGMIVYGAYLQDKEDIIFTAKYTGIFDLTAAIIAMFVIIPACFAYGGEIDGGPGLLFVTLPSIFQGMPFGVVFAIILFIAMTFAGISSIQNMFEVVAESMLKVMPKISRKVMLAILGLVTFAIGVHMHVIYKWGPWMDMVTIYIIPIGAALGAVSWFWVMKKDELLNEINKSSAKVHGDKWHNIGKFVYVPIAVAVCMIALFAQISF